jgi:hypothetical protein
MKVKHASALWNLIISPENLPKNLPFGHLMKGCKTLESNKKLNHFKAIQ